MDINSLKKALLKGILCGLAIALLIPVIRMLIRGGGYLDHLFSMYGIISLISLPIAMAYYYYTVEQKKSKNKEEK